MSNILVIDDEEMIFTTVKNGLQKDRSYSISIFFSNAGFSLVH